MNINILDRKELFRRIVGLKNDFLVYRKIYGFHKLVSSLKTYSLMFTFLMYQPASKLFVEAVASSRF